MTITKKMLSIALVLLMVASLGFARGAKEDASATGKTNLTVLNYIDMSEPNSAREVEMVWDVFSKENPDINVIREDLFNEPFHQKTEAYAASGNLPDVVYMWPGGRSTSLHTQHLTKDLRPFLEKDGLLDDYAPAAIADQTAGYLAELPNGITSSHMMFVNTKLLKDNGLSIPKTYEDLKHIQSVLKPKGIEVIGMDNKDQWVMQSCLFSLIVGRYGGASWYDDLAAGKITFQDPWFVKSLEIIDDLYKSGLLNRNTLDVGYGNGRGNFATGRAAFYIDGDWATASFMTDVSTGKALITPAAQANDFDMIIFPALPGEVLSGTTSGVVGTGFGISANVPAGSAREDAAWRLVKFLQGEYVQTYRLSTGASFPSNLNVDVAKVIKDNNLEPFIEKRATFYQKYGTTPVVDAVLHSDVFNVINQGLQEIGLGSKTPAQVASDVQKAWVAFNK